MSARDTAPLGEPGDSYDGLPASWRAAMAICPHCRGAGHDDAGAPCLPCGESGDLLGAMLLDAYQRGRDHVVARFRELDAARKETVRQVLQEEPSARQLRSAMGMGGGR